MPDILFLYDISSDPNYKTPNSTFALFVQKSRHIANTKQMPEVLNDAIFVNCHLLEYSSHYIDMILLSPF